MGLNLKSKLFINFVIVTIVPLILIGSLSIYLISNEITKQTKEKITKTNDGIYNMIDTQQKLLSRWMNSASASVTNKLALLGKSRFDHENKTYVGSHLLPTWYIGDIKITNNNTISDKLIEEEDLPSTFFQLHNNEFIRVSTTVRLDDGSRITGTTIDSGEVYNKIINGQQFRGRANVEGIWHTTVYQPIWDSSGNLVGAFVIGIREQEYELTKAIKNIVIGDTGYVFIMDFDANNVIHPYMEEQNMSNFQWAKEILHKKNGSITYTHNGKEKIAYYKYYEPWDWYIISVSYTSEIYSTPKNLSVILLITLIIGLIISSIISYKLSKTFYNPINHLFDVMRNVQNGDLTKRLNYYSNGDLKILSSTINTMLNAFSLLIGKIYFNSSNLKNASKSLILDIKYSYQSIESIENIITDVNCQFIRNNCEENKNMNKINNLKLEVEKLKLILKNIYSSASSLDNIASSLEYNVNKFKIEKSKEGEEN